MTGIKSTAIKAGDSEHARELKLAARSRRLAMRFSCSRAEEILSFAIEQEFAGRIALVSSFGAESAVLLHLAAQIKKDIPVIFLDTGKHFAQTLSYRRSLARKLGLTNLRDMEPDRELLAKHDREGSLWRADPDKCCDLRKVEPLKRALDGFDAWITGRKQMHGAGRINLPAFEASTSHIKVNPLIRWSKAEIDNYMAENNLPAHPLISQGYPSIGCWPCTHPVAHGGDPRAGRWRGLSKTECGIHDRNV